MDGLRLPPAPIFNNVFTGDTANRCLQPHYIQKRLRKPTNTLASGRLRLCNRVGGSKPHRKLAYDTDS